MVSFYATKEEVTKAKIFPVPVVIHHGDHSLVVYLDRKLGIREVEVGRHVETLLDHFFGFINEAGLESGIDMYELGLSVGKQIAEYMVKNMHDGKPYKHEYFFENLTTELKTTFSGGVITYSIKEDKVVFKVKDSPFCRTMKGERETNGCAFLAGILAAAASNGISPKKAYVAKETSCALKTGKDACSFTLTEKKK
jgi:predicted hydrocarbon binding protein